MSKVIALDNQLIKDIGKVYGKVSAGKDLSWRIEKVHFANVVNGNYKLQKCTPASLETAAIQSVTMGLSMNPVAGHVCFIPRRERKPLKGENPKEYENKVPMIANASPMYRGLSFLAENRGSVLFIRAEVVYKADLFKYRGPIDKPVHEPTIKTAERGHKNAIGVYAVAKTKHGDFLCEYLDNDQIARIRAMSEFPGGSMWNPERVWTEGWRKAAIRRLYKTLPNPGPELETAIAVLNQTEGAVFDHSPEEKPQEVVRLIDDDQIKKLTEALQKAGVHDNDHDKWLTRLIFAVGGVSDVSELPRNLFDEALNKLNEGLSSWNNAQKSGDKLS